VNLEKKTTHKFLSAAEAAGPFEMKKNFGEGEEEVNHAGRYNRQRFSLFYLCVCDSFLVYFPSIYHQVLG
jgi:hypothetical protein